jgi:hypothetical protein
VAFIKVLTIYQIYPTWIHPLHFSPLSPLPHSWSSFSRSQFSHLHTCVHSICTVFTLLHSFPTSSPSTGINPPPSAQSTCPSCSLIVYKKQKWCFCFLKIAIQRVFLWHFHVFMYYNPNWLISCIFLLSVLLPLLCWFQYVKILYSFLYREYMTYTHFLNFLLLPSISCMWSPLSMTCFS